MGKEPRSPRPNHWDAKESARDRGSRMEKRVAPEFGARLVSNSGATAHEKGDAVNEVFRFEMKTTRGKRVPVDQKILEKIYDEAAETGHLAAVVFTMEGMPKHIQDWVIVEKSTFKDLLK